MISKLPSSNGLDNESIKFWVKDFGDGIPDEKKPFLFQEFSRLQTPQKWGMVWDYPLLNLSLPDRGVRSVLIASQDYEVVSILQRS